MNALRSLCRSVPWRQPKGAGRLAVDWVYRNCVVLLENRVKAKLWVLLVVRFNIRITHSADRDSSTTTIEPYAETSEFNPLALELDIYSLAHHLCKM